MTPAEELFRIADRLEEIRASSVLSQAEAAISAVEFAAVEIGRASSGSWLGYHANVYYNGIISPPPGAHFSQEWGLQDLSYTSLGSRGNWREYDPEALRSSILEKAGMPDLSAVKTAADDAVHAFRIEQAEIKSIILMEISDGSDVFLVRLLADLDKLQPFSAMDIAKIWAPKGQIMTRDTLAASQGTRVPPHQMVKAELSSIFQSFNICLEAAHISRKAASHLERKSKRARQDARVGTNVFIGHGRSSAWRELKDFVQDRLLLPWDEFNRVPVAGVTNQARLSEMLDSAAIAFIIMTAEDETRDGRVQARMNVIHEVGLFQGRLGFTKAIVLVEEGCEEFSNIQGLGQIRFPESNISASFEEIRRVLERERLIESKVFSKIIPNK